jgi:hypothetical protein
MAFATAIMIAVADAAAAQESETVPVLSITPLCLAKAPWAAHKCPETCELIKGWMDCLIVIFALFSSAVNSGMSRKISEEIGPMSREQRQTELFCGLVVVTLPLGMTAISLTRYVMAMLHQFYCLMDPATVWTAPLAVAIAIPGLFSYVMVLDWFQVLSRNWTYRFGREDSWFGRAVDFPAFGAATVLALIGSPIAVAIAAIFLAIVTAFLVAFLVVASILAVLGFFAMVLTCNPKAFGSCFPDCLMEGFTGKAKEASTARSSDVELGARRNRSANTGERNSTGVVNRQPQPRETRMDTESAPPESPALPPYAHTPEARNESLAPPSCKTYSSSRFLDPDIAYDQFHFYDPYAFSQGLRRNDQAPAGSIMDRTRPVSRR